MLNNFIFKQLPKTIQNQAPKRKCIIIVMERDPYLELG